MATLKVHAGDFQKTGADYFFGQLSFLEEGKLWSKVRYGPQDIAELEVASEESVKRVGGTVGWGVAGAVILGPVGLLAGLLAGGMGKDVTFVIKFNDGKMALCTLGSKDYTSLYGKYLDSGGFSTSQESQSMEQSKADDEVEWRKAQDEEWERILRGEGAVDTDRKKQAQANSDDIDRARNKGSYP